MYSKRILHLNPYVPGEQPKDKIYIKLNANENPYPPSPFVAKSISEFCSSKPERLALYPDPDSEELRVAISNHLNKTGGCMNNIKPLPLKITSEMIHCGNGSDEILSFIFYTFFDSDKKLIAPSLTYSFYPVYCGYYSIPLETVDLNDDFTLDTKTMLKKACENSTGMIFANPNAPTAIALSTEQIRQILLNYPSDKILVVDEAYVDFSRESCIGLLSEFKNLVVVRTFSKSMCGAGLRLGYCVAQPEIIKTIQIVKNSFNHFPVDAITQIAGIASCLDTDYYIDVTKKVVETRKNFSAFLKNSGWSYFESDTNFVLAKKDGVSGEEIYKKIKQDGILVRHFNTKGVENFVRITIGTDEQMSKLMDSMKKI